MNDEKKKTVIVGVLFALMLCIGAFQVLGKSKGAPAPAATTASTSATAAGNGPTTTGVKNPEFAQPLAQRDPFAIPASVTKLTDPPKQSMASAIAMNTHSRRHGGLKGSIGDVGNTPVLPDANGQVGITPVSAPEPVLAYHLSGLIEGVKPAAVFTDASGSQRLVPVGGSLDGDTRLARVKSGEVIVIFRGKRLRLSLGGSPDAK